MMLSSDGPGERVVQIAKRPYIRSHIFEICISAVIGLSVKMLTDPYW